MNELVVPKQPSKTGTLVSIPIGLVVIVTWLVLPWIQRVDLLDPVFSILARINAATWAVVLLWSAHHLTFQLAALFKPAEILTTTVGVMPSFTILYATCNDFLTDCCDSLVNQNYPSELFRVVICDDSDDISCQKQIDRFLTLHVGVRVLRRGDRRGFKAGNLNHAFDVIAPGAAEWIVIVDADQLLPRDFLHTLAREVSARTSEVAFIQGRHHPTAELDAGCTDGSGRATGTRFQAALGLEVRLFYDRDLAVRRDCGFLPFLGHGGAIRSSAWRHLGGFPPLVSEDYAFSLRVSESEMRGDYAAGLHSQEAFPQDFGSFIVRMRKFAAGSAELLRKAIGQFLRSRASLVEKYDFMMLLLWYPLMVPVVLNAFLSAYVCHRWWTLDVAALHPLMPFLFVGMFLLGIPVLLSVAEPIKAVRYWFWTTAVYTASLPVAGATFLLHLFREARFERTPKTPHESPELVVPSILTVALGLMAGVLCWRWWSPFSPVLAAHAAAYLAFPLYRRLNDATILGTIARTLAYVPGCFLLAALWTMWYWRE